MNAARKGIALVTGASSGIGLVTAQALAQAGYRVFGTSRKVVPSPAGITMFGVARVVNAVLPIMRAQKGGRIINMSSILGLIPSPFSAYYASTKHAIEGYTESLDHEVRGSGIRVVLVQPGVTRTAFEENLTRADQPMDTYAEGRARSEGLMRKWVEAGDDPQVVADAVVRAATATKPNLRYPAGKQSSQVSMLRRYLPRGIFDKIMRKFNEFPA